MKTTNKSMPFGFMLRSIVQDYIVLTSNTKQTYGCRQFYASYLTKTLLSILIFASILLASCKKEDETMPSQEDAVSNNGDLKASGEISTTGTTIFWGDWESGLVTGSYTHNWGYKEVMADNRITLLSGAGARQGNYFARVEVRNGDNPNAPSSPGTNRAEVSSIRDANNKKVYENESSGIKQYSFSLKFDNTWQDVIDNQDGAGKFAIFFQLHSVDSYKGNPLFALSATDKIRLSMRSGDVSVKPKITYNLADGSLNKGKWIDFIITIKYAKYGTGFVTIDRRNEGQSTYTRVITLENISTLQYSPVVNGGIPGNQYVKTGLYRNNQKFTSILYLDGFTMSTIAPSTNQVPLIQNQTLQLKEGSSTGSSVGTIVASDPDAGQALKYSILSGNTNNAFTINSSTGILTVANSAALDYKTASSFSLVVKVQDNGAGTLSKQATVTVTLISLSTSSAGGITYQIWNNIGNGTAVSDLTSNINFPDNPSSTEKLTSMEARTNNSDNSGTRLAGYICAPISGAYTFWIASNNEGVLWLSTNDQFANRRKIAYHSNYTGTREWGKYTTQKSATINLIKGKYYYVEALMKEYNNGDNLAVGWLKPGQSGSKPSEIIPGSVLSPLLVN